MLSAVVLDGWGAGSLTSNFQPKLTWVAHCMGNMRGALFIKHIGMTYMHKVLTIHMHLVTLIYSAPTHPHTHTPTHTHLIVDRVRCVHVRCPLQNTRLSCLTDLLQGCKVVIKSSTAVFTGGGRAGTLHVHAQRANCTDRQTDRQTGRCIRRQDNDMVGLTLLMQDYTERQLPAQITTLAESTIEPFTCCCSIPYSYPSIHSLQLSLYVVEKRVFHLMSACVF